MWRFEKYYKIFDNKINLILDKDTTFSINIENFV